MYTKNQIVDINKERGIHLLVYIFLVMLIAFLGMTAAKPGEFHRDYMSIESTRAVNGLFTLLVFLSHAVTYVKLSGALDKPYITLKESLGQMVVVTYLFYSGFGMMESIKRKGTDYIRSIPKKRFLKVLIYMDIAVSAFLVLNLLLGKKMKLKTILLAFTTWESIGNSNWYITAILMLYICVFLGFMVARGNKIAGLIHTTVLCLAFVYLQIRLKRPNYCYNTMILFLAGMAFSLAKEKIDGILMKNDAFYFTGSACAVIAYCFFFMKRGGGIEWYSMWGLMFMALLLIVCMKVKINNNILQWFGSHVFSVYILQRIPMIILSHFGFNSHRYAFIAVSFVLTVCLAYMFDVAMAKLDKVLFGEKQKPKMINPI